MNKFQSTYNQNRRSVFRTMIASACLSIVGLVSFLAASPAQASSDADQGRAVIGIEHEGPIKVVFQITDERMADGVHRGLHSLLKLHGGYLKSGFAPDQVQMAAVVHGAASDHLLTDEAWNKYREENDGNPNGDLLEELRREGISIELCDVRRVINGWTKSEIHPDVTLVSNAYYRLIDLQLNGYTYIKL